VKEFEIVFHSKNGFKKKEIQTCTDIPVDCVLVRPRRIGVCGSDIFYRNQYKGNEGLILGHEWVGEVEKSNNSEFLKGDMVTSCAAWGCGECSVCKEGFENQCLKNTVLGSEEFGMLRTNALIDGRNLLKINGLDLDAAALLEVGGIGYAVIDNLKNLNATQGTVLILGAGAVGVMTALVAKEMKISYLLIDTELFRVKLAKKMGLDTLSFGELIASKKKFRNIADCTGDSSGKKGAYAYIPILSQPGTKVLIVGHYEKNWDINSHLYGKFSLQLNWMKGMSRDVYEKAIIFWQDKIAKISKEYITHTFPIEETDNAYEMAIDRKKSLKVLISVGG
jgi:L-iditol 2-dehydrogenase